MHTFFVEAMTEPGGVAELNSRERDHLFKTLRARPGDAVELFDGCGGRMAGIVREGKRVEILSVERVPEPERRLFLYCAAPRRAKFDVLLKQAAELGVRSIRLVECARSVAKPEGSDRWPVLLQEGCKQSKNPFVPEIVPPVPLAVALEEIRAEHICAFFGAIRSGERGAESAAKLAWIVGPEGGFTDEEEAAMRAAGVRGLNLGPYVLRLETAAVCGLAVLRQWMEQ